MMTKIMLVTLLVTCLSTSRAGAETSRAGDQLWRIPASLMPAGTVVRLGQTTNAAAQSIFGRAHQTTYRALGRLAGRGWYEGGTLVKPGAGGGPPHTFNWTYLVSYF